MKHISGQTFQGSYDNGRFILPVTKYMTYCRLTVLVDEIDNEHPTCDECMDAHCWEQIDTRHFLEG
jgi:hypothetical protein